MIRRTNGRINFKSTGKAKYIKPAEEPKLPSKMKMAGNLFKAGVAAVREGFAQRSESEINEILEKHCNPCERSINKNTNGIRCTHPECGCRMKYKSILKAWHCPDKKW
jgi:hypothetical protein